MSAKSNADSVLTNSLLSPPPSPFPALNKRLVVSKWTERMISRPRQEQYHYTGSNMGELPFPHMMKNFTADLQIQLNLQMNALIDLTDPETIPWAHQISSSGKCIRVLTPVKSKVFVFLIFRQGFHRTCDRLTHDWLVGECVAWSRAEIRVVYLTLWCHMKPAQSIKTIQILSFRHWLHRLIFLYGVMHCIVLFQGILRLFLFKKWRLRGHGVITWFCAKPIISCFPCWFLFLLGSEHRMSSFQFRFH